MSGYVDLHCHWVWEIDDGARTAQEGLEMLRGLAELGFSHVVGTPHIRPGLFDNTRQGIFARFNSAREAVVAHSAMPEVSLGAEHFFEPTVVGWIEQGQGLPYGTSLRPEGAPNPGGGKRKAVLVEFTDLAPLHVIERGLSRLMQHNLLPVIAHPERYRSVWKEPASLYRLVDLGCSALLDICALVGKYGSAPKRAARSLLEAGAYSAACSDAHRPQDIALTGRAISQLGQVVGEEERQFLLSDGPRALLQGLLPSA